MLSRPQISQNKVQTSPSTARLNPSMPVSQSVQHITPFWAGGKARAGARGAGEPPQHHQQLPWHSRYRRRYACRCSSCATFLRKAGLAAPDSPASSAAEPWHRIWPAVLPKPRVEHGEPQRKAATERQGHRSGTHQHPCTCSAESSWDNGDTGWDNATHQCKA